MKEIIKNEQKMTANDYFQLPTKNRNKSKLLKYHTLYLHCPLFQMVNPHCPKQNLL